MLSTIFSTPQLPLLGSCARPPDFPIFHLAQPIGALAPATYKDPSELRVFSLLEDSHEAHSPGEEHILSSWLLTNLTCLFFLRLGPSWPSLLQFQPLNPTLRQSRGMAMATVATDMAATTDPTATATGAGRGGLLNQML